MSVSLQALAREKCDKKNALPHELILLLDSQNVLPDEANCSRD